MAFAGLAATLENGTRAVIGAGFFASTLRAAFVRLFGLLANAAFFALAGNFFGPSALGRFAIAMIILMIATTICGHGLTTVLVRFTGQDVSKDNLGIARQRLEWSVRRVASVSLVVSLAAVASAHWVAEFVFSDPQLALPIGILSACLVPFCIVQLAASFAQGIGHVGLAMALRHLLVPMFSTLALLVLFSMWGAEPILAIAYAAGILVACAVAIMAFAFYGAPSAVLPSASREEMLRVAYPLLLSGVAGMLLGWADTIMLGILGSSNEVGMYALAFRLTLFVSLAREIVNTVGAGRLATAFAAGDARCQQKILSQLVHINVFFAVPLIIVLFLFTEPALAIVGTEFESAAALIRILLVGELLCALFGSSGLAMQMTGLERPLSRIVFGALIVNILLNLLLIPQYGAVGAALATAFTSAAQRGAMALAVFRAHGIISLFYLSGVRCRSL